MNKLVVSGLSKHFGSRKVFSALDFELSSGESMAVTGPNGSGKSTLLMTLLALYRPTRGSVAYLEDDRPLDDDDIRTRVSFVSPYLNLYDHLSAEENLKFFATVAGGNVPGKDIDRLLARVGLEGRGCDLVAGYSSGMKQRLKYAVALLKKPAYLFLDEPTSNLDEAGKRLVTGIIEECRSESVIVIATNEQEEYTLAAKQCRLGQ
ncbi:MAG: ABC transporter ATP-binding protein [candidate division Zixibacteria bacterium]|nr:ABC transporter ATP-binding protein [candidate division Zixibacteria bacterium]